MTIPTTTPAKAAPNKSIRKSSLADPVRARRIGSWPVLITGMIGLVMAALVYLGLTDVSGIELNSHTWEQRVFSFRRDPVSGFQFTAVQHNAPLRDGLWGTRVNPRARKLPTSIAVHLNAKTHLPLRWDFVELDNRQFPGANASILVSLLDATNRSYDPFWPKWSTDHPQQAAILWPAAQQLVEFGQYAKLPALLDLALRENNSSQLSTSIGQLVQTAMLEVCQQCKKQGYLSEARVAAQVGLLYGDHPDLQKCMESAP